MIGEAMEAAISHCPSATRGERGPTNQQKFGKVRISSNLPSAPHPSSADKYPPATPACPRSHHAIERYRIVFALFFAQLGDNYSSIQTRLGFFQQLGGFYITGMFTNAAVYPQERDVAYLEIEDGAYTVNGFFASVRSSGSHSR